jgi:hypothetical protein
MPAPLQPARHPDEPPLPIMDNGMSLDQLESGVQAMNGVPMDEQTLAMGGPQPQPPAVLPQQEIDLPDPPTPEEWKAMQAPERAADRAYTLAVRDLVTTAGATGMSQRDFGNAMALLQAERMKAQIKAAPGSINSVTNQVTGEVFNVYSHPTEGSRIIDPKIIQSQDGTRAIWGGTNSVLIRDKDSKAPTMGYMAEPAEDGGAGGIFGQTNAPTNAPSPTPTPAPAQKPVSVAELQSRLGIALPPGTHALPNGRTITVIP